MFELFLILLCDFVTVWYLRESDETKWPRVNKTNPNAAVDEWNAREMMEEESESFYE